MKDYEIVIGLEVHAETLNQKFSATVKTLSDLK